jgi:excisionase family DNA binding protein
VSTISGEPHTVEQTARRLHASRSRVFELLAAGELESVRVGRSRCVFRRSVEELLGRLGAA